MGEENKNPTVRAGRDEAGYANSDGESGDSDGGSDGEGDGVEDD